MCQVPKLNVASFKNILFQLLLLLFFCCQASLSVTGFTWLMCMYFVMYLYKANVGCDAVLSGSDYVDIQFETPPQLLPWILSF